MERLNFSVKYVKENIQFIVSLDFKKKDKRRAWGWPSDQRGKYPGYSDIQIER